MTVADTIKAKLTDKLAPVELEVIDESHKHAGHVGARPEGETHFQVNITSALFNGKSRVERQRLVYEVLAEELRGPVHALGLSTQTPTN